MIVVDVETTGLDAKKNSIVSIGAVDFNKPSNTFYQACSIWPGAEIEQEALDINGFTREEITNPEKPTLEQTMKDFGKWIDQFPTKIIAGQNPDFDKSFLEESAKRYDLEWPIGRRIVDLHTLCYTHKMRVMNEEGKLNSDEIMRYVGIPTEPKPHEALNGAIWETEAFYRLIFAKNAFPMFSKDIIPEYLTK